MARPYALTAGKTDEEKRAMLLPVIERTIDGERLEEIAEELGVHRSAINQLLIRYTEEEWKEAQVAKAWTKFEQCVEDLSDAERTPDQTSVSRAREAARLAQWTLEKLHRRLFGDEQAQHLLGQGMVQINISLSDKTARERTVDDAQVIDSK